MRSFRAWIVCVWWVGVAFVLHSAITTSLFSLLPAPLVLSHLIAYAVSQPLPYIVFFAALAELYSLRMPGVMAAVIIVPWLVKRFTGYQAIDLSFSWLAITAATVALQVVIIYLPDLLRFAHTGLLQRSLLPDDAHLFFPWVRLAALFCMTTLFVYFLTIALAHRRASSY